MRIALLTVLIASCAGTAPLGMPMTAARAAQYNSGPALVAYLSQTDASPELCDLESTGPHLTALTPELRAAFVDGLHDGSIKPAIWRRCATTLLRRLSPDAAATLFDELFAAYHKMLVSSDADTNPALVERVSTIQSLYLDRAPGIDAHPAVIAPLLSEFRAAIPKKKLGHVATLFAQELLDTVDVENGVWHGQPVTTDMLDALAKAGNELTLTRFVERLPDPALRTEARRRLIRIHIALSPFTEVQHAGPELETAILQSGHNTVKLASHPVVKASFERETIQRNVIVRQHVWQRTATLLGTANDRANVSVLPELPLRGALLVQVQGISRPVTVCGHDKDLDPSRCIALSDLSVDNPLATLGATGAVKLRDDLPITDALPLASQDGFAMGIRIGGRPAATLTWGLRFAPPENLVFPGAPAGRGPDLSVHVGQPRTDRAMFDVNALGTDYIAIIELADLANYRVLSIGGAGYRGSDGSPGASGSSGSTCSNGGDGGRGGDGGNGGPGGNGGDITVQLTCTSMQCRQLPVMLAGVIASVGGAGGAGGSGGRGGAGGSGGSSQSPTTHTDSNGNTVTDDPGCSAGSSGSNGANGTDGSRGANGRPGRVSL